MKRLITLALLLSYSVISSPVRAEQKSIDGYWAGAASLPGDDMRFSVTFKTDANGVTGTFEIPDSGYLPLPQTALASVSLNDSKVHFEIPRGGNATVSYDGEIAGDTIAGTFSNGKATGTFTLKRSVPVPPPYKEEEVRFQSGGVTLVGSLLTPTATKSPHPAIVFHHGARANNRNAWRFFADYFARRGIACLIYDNRGAGTPQTLNVISFDELADDALAGVQFLKTRRDINPKQIGLVAGSQGAWISPLAASRSKEVAFLLLISAPGVTQAENIQYESETRLRDQAFSEDEIGRALDFKKKVSAMIIAREPDAKIEAAVEQVKHEKWFPAIGIPAADSPWRRFFALTLAYDPAPVWEKVTVPVLLVYGGLDKNVRVAQSAPRIAQALKKAGNKHFTIKIYPRADHGLNELTAQSRPHRTAELMNFMTGWLLKTVKVRS